MPKKTVIIVTPSDKRNTRAISDVTSELAMSVKKALFQRGLSRVEVVPLERSDFEKDAFQVKRKILYTIPAFIFNLFDGFSNDSMKEVEFARVLEEMKMPFTGNLSYTLDTCLDKERTKIILNQNGIETPPGIYVKKLQNFSYDELTFPLFVKPCFEDGSIGIDNDALVKNRDCLDRIIKDKLRKFPQGIIIEKFIFGCEYNVGFVGNYPYELLGISMLDYARHSSFPPFLTYRAKWEKDSEEFLAFEPVLNAGILEWKYNAIVNIASRVGKILKCRGYFRIDLRENENRFYVLDVNPNPDISTNGGFAKQAYSKGYTYDELIWKIARIGFSQLQLEEEKICAIRK